MTVIEVAKIAFETDHESVAETAIWTFTGYPSFWALRKNETPMRCFWRQLRHARRSMNRGYSIEQIYEGTDREVENVRLL